MRFVFCNAGRFFKNRAPIFRSRAQHHVDLALFHHRVGGAADAGVRKKILDVAQTAGRLVEQVFRIAVAINTARYAHVMPVHAELVRAIVEGE